MGKLDGRSATCAEKLCKMQMQLQQNEMQNCLLLQTFLKHSQLKNVITKTRGFLMGATVDRNAVTGKVVCDPP